MICKRNEGRHGINLDDLGLKEEQIIVLSVAGSKMYGTATKDSDTDYLGIFKPTRTELLMNKVNHHVKLPKESGLDLQMWSIYYFIKLACQGETMAIDLLHSSYYNWIFYNPDIWGGLRNKKHMFYTKNMKAFVSYARKQAAKYGVKGNRIEAIREVITFLSGCDKTRRLREVWNSLPHPEHVHFLDGNVRMYQVCGMKLQETVTIEYSLTLLNKILTGYGDRALKAANNEGIDWKAFSHAIRAANQVYDILTTGGYKYPLKNAKFITMVKTGQIKYEMAEAVLDDFMSEIDRLMKQTSLPEEVDKAYWNKWLLEYIEEEVL